MAVTCKNCGGAHAIWECKRPATKSTALLKEASAGSVRGKAGREKVAQPEPVRASQAGTQALPVDTNSPPGLATGFSTTSAGTVGEKDRQPKFDKKAWSRAYMKIWMRNKRAKLKAASPGA